MKKITLTNKFNNETLEVKVSNKREQSFVSITNDILERAYRYYNENTFGNRTYDIIVNQNMLDVKKYIECFYFMGMITESQFINSNRMVSLY